MHWNAALLLNATHCTVIWCTAIKLIALHCFCIRKYTAVWAAPRTLIQLSSCQGFATKMEQFCQNNLIYRAAFTKDAKNEAGVMHNAHEHKTQKLQANIWFAHNSNCSELLNHYLCQSTGSLQKSQRANQVWLWAANVIGASTWIQSFLRLTFWDKED